MQIESVDTALCNRVWNVFFTNNNYLLKSVNCDGHNSIIENLLDAFGHTFEYPDGMFDREKNMKKLKEIFSKNDWFFVYDFIEKYLDLESESSKITANDLAKEINRILEEEKSGYRIIKRLVVPITNEQELKSLHKATKTKYDAVNVHMNKALLLYSRRKNPDYENSIKESISTIEALCCIITEKNKASLGDALKKIDDRGLGLHKALKSAINQLYGYTSDENGIRHAGIDFKGAFSEDAKYMLVSCSVFVNYIIEKWEKNI
nr:hypothetical protein [Sporomusa acidovorans]